jgi:hypothetical protein
MTAKAHTPVEPALSRVRAERLAPVWLLGVQTPIVACLRTDTRLIRLPTPRHDVDELGKGLRVVVWDDDPDRDNWNREAYSPDVAALRDSMHPAVCAIARVPVDTPWPVVHASLNLSRHLLATPPRREFRRAFDAKRHHPALISPIYGDGLAADRTTHDGLSRVPHFVDLGHGNHATLWESLPHQAVVPWLGGHPPITEDAMLPLVDAWTRAHGLHLAKQLHKTGEHGRVATSILRHRTFNLGTIVAGWETFIGLAREIEALVRDSLPAGEAADDPELGPSTAHSRFVPSIPDVPS